MATADDVRLGYLMAPEFAPTLWSWARAEAQIQLLHEYLLDEGGALDDDDDVRPAAEFLEKVERRALKLRERLGLDPLSRARLGRDVVATAVDVARVMAEGESRDAAGMSEGGDDEDLVDVDELDDEEGERG